VPHRAAAIAFDQRAIAAKQDAQADGPDIDVQAARIRVRVAAIDRHRQGVREQELARDAVFRAVAIVEIGVGDVPGDGQVRDRIHHGTAADIGTVIAVIAVQPAAKAVYGEHVAGVELSEAAIVHDVVFERVDLERGIADIRADREHVAAPELGTAEISP
jgi:hypothetical protein